MRTAIRSLVPKTSARSSPLEGICGLPEFLGVERPLEIGRLSCSIRTFHQTDADQEIAARQVFTVGVLVLIGRLDFGLAGDQRIVSAGKCR